jgi:uncharacterized protein
VHWFVATRHASWPDVLETFFHLLVFAGALIQVAVGIGFSVIVAPAFIVAVGAKSAVPILLVMNLAVSIIALAGTRRDDWDGLRKALPAVTVGLVLGALVLPRLSSSSIGLLVGVLLIVGAVPFRPAKLSDALATGAPVLAGLATVLTATPGPLTALGFIWRGLPANKIRSAVQPFAAICYATALAFHGSAALAAAHTIIEMPTIAVALVAGCIAGLIVSPWLPAAVIIPSIRMLAAAAGVFLIARSLIIGPST